MTHDTEFIIQSYISTQLKRRDIFHHGDQNAGKRGPRAQTQMKASGACKGWPDMCIIYKGGVYWIELKTIKGSVSKEQKEVHERLAENGQSVYIVKEARKEDAWKKIQMILNL